MTRIHTRTLLFCLGHSAAKACLSEFTVLEVSLVYMEAPGQLLQLQSTSYPHHFPCCLPSHLLGLGHLSPGAPGAPVSCALCLRNTALLESPWFIWVVVWVGCSGTFQAV